MVPPPLRFSFSQVAGMVWSRRCRSSRSAELDARGVGVGLFHDLVLLLAEEGEEGAQVKALALSLLLGRGGRRAVARTRQVAVVGRQREEEQERHRLAVQTIASDLVSQQPTNQQV